MEGQLFNRNYPSPPPTFSPEGLSVIMQKMAECRSEECPEDTACQRNPCSLPSRVLDVSKDGAGIDRIALAVGNFEGVYASLSHCWGGI
jgi:hypothetical protein